MGENYTAEEYRKVLMLIYDMDTEEREKVFGVSKFIPGYIEEFSVSELIEKYHAYKNAPKAGEYWKRKDDGEMVVVRYIKDSMVIVYYCNGGFGCSHSLTYFTDYFTKTKYKSKYIEDFLKEMKEMSK